MNIENKKQMATILLAVGLGLVASMLMSKVVNDKIMIEMKCKVCLTQEDKKQFWYYLKASDYRVGYLINFSPKRAEIIRRVYDTARKQSV